MLEQLFRTNEAAQSTVYGVLMSTLASFFLSFLLVLTYRLTSTEVVERREFIQGMALISIVATMIMQAIGDSLARGLGMLGALSIIRFRTSLTSPRNMAFMFASLAVGIACGVFGFTIAFIGTTAFCLAALALHFEFRGDEGRLRGELRVTLTDDDVNEAALRELLSGYATRLRMADRRYKTVLPPAPPALDPTPDPTANGTHSTTASPLNPAQTLAQGSAPAAAPAAQAAPNGGAAVLVTSAAAREEPKPERQRVVTYQFRFRRRASELELLRALAAYPGIADERLRFTEVPETL